MDDSMGCGIVFDTVGNNTKYFRGFLFDFYLQPRKMHRGSINNHVYESG